MTQPPPITPLSPLEEYAAQLFEVISRLDAILNEEIVLLEKLEYGAIIPLQEEKKALFETYSKLIPLVQTHKEELLSNKTLKQKLFDTLDTFTHTAGRNMKAYDIAEHAHNKILSLFQQSYRKAAGPGQYYTKRGRYSACKTPVLSGVINKEL